MPEVTRVGTDTHVGHASPTPNPFHQTSYASGSPENQMHMMSGEKDLVLDLHDQHGCLFLLLLLRA